MKVLVCLFLAILSVSNSFADDDIKLEDGVLVLNKDNFQKAIDSNEFILVEFCKYTIQLLDFHSSHYWAGKCKPRI